MVVDAEIDERLDGAVVVASVSGGKDSTALSLHLSELGIEHGRVFADTGWEHPWTYEHVDYLQTVLGPIDKVQSDVGGMAQWIEKKGRFPSRRGRWCTDELKVKPIKKYVREAQDMFGDVVNAVGIRGQESKARSKMEEWEWSDAFDCWVWRPLINWSEQDVIDIHTRHGVKPNRLYLEYNSVTRVGCWPCIFSRKSEIATISRESPWRIDQIEDLEAMVKRQTIARLAVKGETLEEKGWNPPTFFNVSDPIADTALNDMVPIRDVVEWSQTGTGGRQNELFYDYSGGCVRWGLCETSGEPPPSSEPDISEPE